MTPTEQVPKTSKMLGTTFDKTAGRWKAQVRLNGKLKSLGYHDTQQLAFEAVQREKGVAVAIALPPSVLDQPAMVAAIDRNRGNRTVAQSNYLARTPLGLSLLEARVFVLMLRCLRRDDTEPKDIIIPLEDLVGPPGPGTSIAGSVYALIHQALDRLGAIQIKPEVPDPTKDYDKFPLVQRLKLDSGSGVIVGKFSEDALPYVTNLKGNFTLGQVADLMSIKSATTHKFYWLMMSYARSDGRPGSWKPSVNELRLLTTGPDAYPQYSDYRHNVLNPTIAELNDKLNFNIQVKEIKVGRVVESVNFKVRYTEPARPLPPPRQQLTLALDNNPENGLEKRPLNLPAWLANHPKMDGMKQYQRLIDRFDFAPADARAVMEGLANEEAFLKVTRTMAALLTPPAGSPPIANMAAVFKSRLGIKK